MQERRWYTPWNVTTCGISDLFLVTLVPKKHTPTKSVCEVMILSIHKDGHVATEDVPEIVEMAHFKEFTKGISFSFVFSNMEAKNKQAEVQSGEIPTSCIN